MTWLKGTFIEFEESTATGQQCVWDKSENAQVAAFLDGFLVSQIWVGVNQALGELDIVVEGLFYGLA